MKGKKKVYLIPLAVLVLIIPVLFLKKESKSGPVTLETAVVKKGSIANTISATGTVEPLDKVEVGTQVSGVIEKIYADYNATVKKGQLLAELDKTTLKASLQSTLVSLQSAKIECEYLQKKQHRIAQLFQKNMVSQENLDQATYELERSRANVEKAETEVQRAKQNLSYATIYSPIDGTVLSRSVDEGQTVAASLNAPTLFTIARDLKRMEVNAAVDEADIGQVKKDQRVTFTVDAFPGETFKGNVSQVRLEPTVTSNVVTYTATILAQNDELKLLPGMTATITVYVKEADCVLIIPAKALRFQPDPDVLEKMRAQFSKNSKERMTPPHDRMAKNHVTHSESDSGGFQERMFGNKANKNSAHWRSGGKNESALLKDGKQVWIKMGELMRPVPVKIGINDAITVEVTEGLKEGDEVVLSIIDANKKEKKVTAQSSESVNPFMPQRPGRSQRRMR